MNKKPHIGGAGDRVYWVETLQGSNKLIKSKALKNAGDAFFEKKAIEQAEVETDELGNSLTDPEKEQYIANNNNGFIQPIIEILREMEREHPNSMLRAISTTGARRPDQGYYNMMKKTLDRAMPGYSDLHLKTPQELGEILLLQFARSSKDIAFGQIIMYIPDRDLFSGLSNKKLYDPDNNIFLNNTENLRIELVNDDNIPIRLQDISGVSVANLLVPKLSWSFSSADPPDPQDEYWSLTGEVMGALLIGIPAGGSAFKLKGWHSIELTTTLFADPDTLYSEDVNGVREPFVKSAKKTIQLDQYFASVASSITGVIVTDRIHDNNLKYNYANVLLEQKLGKETQTPLNYFNRVSIDKNKNRDLYGPYRINNQVQRIKRNTSLNKQNFNKENVDYYGPDLERKMHSILPRGEGSLDDQRQTAGNTTAPFQAWAKENSAYEEGEDAVPITHTVHNPNVEEVSISLQIGSLFDTVEKDFATGQDSNIFKAGDKIPAILNIRVEIGMIDEEGVQEVYSSRDYRITALIQTNTLLDIGNPDQLNNKDAYDHIKVHFDFYQNQNATADISHNQAERTPDINVPFKLPPVRTFFKNNEGETLQKRFVRVTKLSTETFSVLIDKQVKLAKVTEIIPTYFSYPYSAIFGMKVDTKSFNKLPQRTFDARLKKIQIPSNYYPMRIDDFGKDKRYYIRKNELDDLTEDQKKVYSGDWDGSFKIGWTDNPAWILYDLLTSSRYGLGQQVSETEINKWELYKIGRFCDAVDDNGVFVGVPDGRGGLEPRYSCNILFNSKEKIFDAIQLISDLFRGKTFFRNSEVSFLSQTIKSPIATFSNVNVKDGIFNYSNFRRDQQFNTVEVAYKDRFENFAPKIETVEDHTDISSRGVFKTTIEAVGVTSRAMARRIGQHLIFKTVNENQRIAFTAGLESLLCHPGDLIIVDDDLKSNTSNFGKIMSVDADNQYIRLSGPFDSSSMTGILTVYNPTGMPSIDDLNAIANKKRRRHSNFTITGDDNILFNSFTGDYAFSGYESGYDLTEEELADESEQRFEEYALYTGTGDNILYFNTEHTGWVFSTELTHQDNDNYDIWISDTGFDGGMLDSINFNSGVYAFRDDGDRRDRSIFRDLSGSFSGLEKYVSMRDGGGILESEITNGTPSQIVTLNVTGENSVGDVIGERGSFISGVDKPELLNFIKVGSPYRYQIQESSDTIYQIDSIREENINEYEIAGIKFDTGKYDLIEKNISIEKKENTFAYSVAAQVGDKLYTTLDAPTSLNISTGEDVVNKSFYVSGLWPQVTNNKGYRAKLHFPNGRVMESIISEDVTGVKFTGINSVGNFLIAVKTIGDRFTSDDQIFFDSDYIIEQQFFLYEDIVGLDRPMLNHINFR